MLESILLVAALSLDAFVASIAYGTNRIKIPFSSLIIINFICAFFLAISISFASIIKNLIPGNITSIISFMILMLLGTYYLFESIIKSYLKKKFALRKKLKLNIFNLRFIINVYIDETKADLNNSKHLNSKEALYLAIALSLDSLAIGFGCSLGSINYIQVILFSLIADMIAIIVGLFIGRKFVERTKIDLSWLAGAILIILAFLKFM